LVNKIKSKSAFTLAEILITLVIIGVVASLTISAVINTYVESSTVAKVKKGISTIGQAKKLAEAQNGSIEGWNFGEGATAENAAQLWNYLKPHISVLKDCGSNGECYSVNTKKLQGNDISYSDAQYYYFILQDGGVMWFRVARSGKCSVFDEYRVENECSVWWYDVNGDKKPNTIGRDIFMFIMSANGIYPTAYNDCYKNMDGTSCAGYIIKHNNMKYLH